MPNKFESEKQRRLFYAAAKDPEVAKRKDIPQSVAKEMIGDSVKGYMDAVSRGDSDMIESARDKLRK